jgi:hypothetical protein
MHAKDHIIGIKQYQEDGFLPYWKGYWYYKLAPICEVYGSQMEGKYGYFIPLNFAHVTDDQREDTKKADIATLNIKEVGNGFTAKGNIELYANKFFTAGLKFPVMGWRKVKKYKDTTSGNEEVVSKSFRLELDTDYLNYIKKDEYLAELAQKGKEPPEFSLEDPLLDYTDEQLEQMHKNYPDAKAFFEFFIESERKKSIVTENKMLMPGKVQQTKLPDAEKAPY